ncbi:uncharacterized protein LOC103703443 isoform X2 [Phoenix dactylifera]|uniref:Uncharacterized protein LOC103703443 isoform X2 n=1 Tax=Phoenix dactylifera TaxID=42345 RepID=A0A8B7BSL5_PHODC|nr:uncharacterized protein LOC103703443 isoform X2 [Phoenix dactylifera]
MYICMRSSNDATSFIIVEFESCNEEDIISSREDALARLRFRSIPLQDGECSHIKEGECVLAMRKGQTRSLFFDAVIEKTYKVKHSNRVHCRCTFEVKWFNTKLNEETMTVPSKSVMKLSDKDIDSHPVFAAFLTALTCRNGVEVPSFLDLLEETTCETDLHGLLEKQIEEITKLADGSDGSKDVLLEVKRANLNGRKQSEVVASSQTFLLSSHDDFRRSTRSQSKQVEIKHEKHLKDVPLLSPLAARAALASLVHELPHEPEFPICQIEKDGHEDTAPEDLARNINEHFLDVEGLLVNSDSKIRNDASVVLSSTQNLNSNAPVEDRNLSTSSISTRRNSMKKSVFEESPDSLGSQKKAEGASKESGKKLGGYTIVKHLKTSVTNGKLSGSMATARLTRSAVRREILNSTIEVGQGSSNEKFKSLVSTRFMHSAEQKMRSDANIKLQVESSNLIQDEEEIVTPENSESKKKKLIPSSVDTKTNLTLESRKRTRASSVTAPTKEDQGEILQDGENYPATKKKASSSKKPTLRFSPRLRFLPRTRSQKKTSAAC